MKSLVQVELDARVVLEYLEANGIFSPDELLLWIDAHIQMVEEQIVVGAILAVSSAQNVSPRRRGWSLRRLWRRCLLTTCSGSGRRSLSSERARDKGRYD